MSQRLVWSGYFAKKREFSSRRSLFVARCGPCHPHPSSLQSIRSVEKSKLRPNHSIPSQGSSSSSHLLIHLVSSLLLSLPLPPSSLPPLPLPLSAASSFSLKHLFLFLTLFFYSQPSLPRSSSSTIQQTSRFTNFFFSFACTSRESPVFNPSPPPPLQPFTPNPSLKPNPNPPPPPNHYFRLHCWYFLYFITTTDHHH